MVTTTHYLLTPKEAAKLLGVSKCTVYRWLKRGWLLGIVMPNGTIRIPKVKIDRILAEK